MEAPGRGNSLSAFPLLTLFLGGIAMPEKVVPGPVQDSACIREAVCIHTKKIFDSCKEEDIALYKQIFR